MTNSERSSDDPLYAVLRSPRLVQLRDRIEALLEEKHRMIKFEDDAAHGVTEYWLIEPEAEIVEQYALSQGRYTLAAKSRTGTLASVAIPGFEIPVRAIFDKEENLRTLRTILSTTQSP